MDDRSVTYTPTYEDLLAAARLHGNSGRYLKKRAIAVAIAAPALVALVWGLIQGSRLANEPRINLAIYLTGGLIALSLFVSVFIWCALAVDHVIFVPRGVGRTYAQFKELKCERTIAWSTAGIEVLSSRGHWTTPRADYIRTRENDKIILLYITDNRSQFIPKRALNAAQLSSLTPFLSVIPINVDPLYQTS